MSLVSDQAVAIDWRAPVFAHPTRTRVTPSGNVVRREILSESPRKCRTAPTPVPSSKTCPRAAAEPRRHRGAATRGPDHRGRIPRAATRDPRAVGALTIC
jgi:hypothetical protein